MGLPDTILDKVSRFFDNGFDDILIYVLVFLFFLLSGTRDDRQLVETDRSESGFPVIIIVIFLFVFLFFGFKRESGDNLEV